jgi:hypothetical protein
MNIANLLAAIDMLLAINEQARAVSERIKAARAENRDLTDAELDELASGAAAAIADAKAAGVEAREAGR